MAPKGRKVLNILKLDEALATNLKKSAKGHIKRLYYYECVTCLTTIELTANQISTATGKCQSCIHVGKPYEAIYNSMKRAAKLRNLAFELTYEHYLLFVNRSCFYCADEMVWVVAFSKGSSQAYNIDRKDNAIGYVLENCVPCCPSCNLTKRGLSGDQFIKLAQKIAKVHPETSDKGKESEGTYENI